VNEQNKHDQNLLTASVNASKDEFLALLTHQLKTPVTSLKLKLQLANRILGNAVPSPDAFEQLKKVLGGADQDADRITRIIDDFQDRKEKD